MNARQEVESSTLDAALDLARRGIGCIAVRIGGKGPAIASPHPEGSDERRTCKGECGLPGHGVYDATTDEGQMRAWFGPGAPYEHHNIGAAVPAGCAVLDVDTQHDGHTTFLQLKEDLGDAWAKCAPRQRTGNGGVHLWFGEHGVEIKVKSGIGIDVRRDGTYVVVEPSIHQNGSPYRWERPLPTTLEELPPLPEDILAWLAPGPTPESTSRSNRVYGQGEDGLRLAVEREWTWNTLLGKHGWTLVKGNGVVDGSAWRHPESHNESSASLRYNCLFNYSLSRPLGLPVCGEGGKNGVTLVHAVVLFEYGGDTKDHYRRLAEDFRARGLLDDGWYDGPLDELVDRSRAESKTAEANVEGASSWHRIDLHAVLAGTVEQTLPTVLERGDELCCFYPGCLNGVHGDSGIGKSMALAVAAAQEMHAARHVVWVDLEDPSATPLIERLRMLGIDAPTIAERLHYYAPRDPFTGEAVAELVREAKEYEVSLLVVDSLGEAFALNGVNEDKDAEVGPFLRSYIRPLADAGPAVVIVDHATKAGDNALHPSGSKRKRAAIQGASYLIEAKRALTREDGGALHLVCAKDRHGNYKRGATVARIDLRVDLLGVTVKVSAPEPQVRQTPEAHLHALADAAVRVTKQADHPLTQTELLAFMPNARKDLKCAAIERAERLGSIRIDPEGRKHLHSYVKDLPATEES